MSFTRHNWSNKTQKQPRSFQEQRSAWCFIDWKPEMLKVLCHCLETLLATLSLYISFLYYFFFHSFFPCIFNRYFPMKDVHKKMTLFFFFFLQLKLHFSTNHPLNIQCFFLSQETFNWSEICHCVYTHINFLLYGKTSTGLRTCAHSIRSITWSRLVEQISWCCLVPETVSYLLAVGVHRVQSWSTIQNEISYC